MEPESRYLRRHPGESADQRSAPQRDRDRIIYTLALRRLAGVTQVVSATEGHIFHNRLTHTVEVAQIAKRLAEKLAGSSKPEHLAVVGEINPEVVEAAAYAHDLGHPPFGHVAEAELDRLVRLAGDPDGFEGNAQSFRIVTKLAAHSIDHPGINLTRATLNAVLKYPWHRDLDPNSGKYHKKFGAYRSEEADFQFARSNNLTDRRKSVEAAIMDVADGVAYSVHDLDDFYRAGLIPVDILANNPNELEKFFKAWIDDPSAKLSKDELEANRELFQNALDFELPREPYTGTTTQRAGLRNKTSSLIREFVFAVQLEQNDQGEVRVSVEQARDTKMKFLQRLVWHYVIDNPRLGSLQHGQRTVIRFLYRSYLRAVRTRDQRLVPPFFQQELKALGGASKPRTPTSPTEARLACDIVASFTDFQAQLHYRRLNGTSTGSVVDLI